MIVVEAGVVLGLVLPLPFSDQAGARMRALSQANEDIYAPALLEYEVCSVLRRAISRGVIDAARAEQAIEWIGDIRIRPITAASSLHTRALHWASRLGQSKAYDAQYLALAEQMNCPLVTAAPCLMAADVTMIEHSEELSSGTSAIPELPTPNREPPVTDWVKANGIVVDALKYGGASSGTLHYLGG